MANLQKVIKVTQSQYNVLASGGRVGDYVGLDDNYIYLIEDTNTYITSNGGTINGGDLTIEGNARLNVEYGSGVHVYDSNHDTIAGLGADMYGSEIIYSSSTDYLPLFANDNGYIIFSEDNDYNHDIVLNTGVLTILDSTDTGNRLTIDADEANISTKYGNTQYNHFLPTQSGTIALTSDLSNYHAKNASVIPTANGTLDIGSSSYNYKDIYLSGKSYIGTTSLYTLNTNLFVDLTNNGDDYAFYGAAFAGIGGNKNLGTNTYKWQDLYLSRNLTDGTNSITVAEVVAKQDAVQVKRYI